MTSVDIHPEDLIDKLLDGELSGAERDRVRAHLELCAVCRFEVAVRRDLMTDAPASAERPQHHFEAPFQVTLSAPRLARRESPPPVVPVIRSRTRRRWSLVLLAGALVLCAGGATAAVVSHTVAARFWGWSLPQSSSAVSKPSLKHAPDPKSARTKVGSESAASASPGAEPAANSSSVPVDAAPIPVASLSHGVERDAQPRARPSGVRSTASVASGSSVRLSGALPTDQPSDSEPATRASADTAAAGAPATLSDAAALFAEANGARRAGNMERAIALYRSLQARYPSSGESELSRAVLAQLLLERGNAEAALAGFDRYLAGGSPALDAEALVGRARALEQLARPEQAAAAWKDVQRRFPGSVHARLASARLAALGMR